eukprot:5524872-Pyramimonas_sp.AAC.1
MGNPLRGKSTLWSIPYSTTGSTKSSQRCSARARAGRPGACQAGGPARPQRAHRRGGRGCGASDRG